MTAREAALSREISPPPSARHFSFLLLAAITTSYKLPMMRLGPATAAKYLAFARSSTAFRFASPHAQQRLTCLRMMSTVPSVKVS